MSYALSIIFNPAASIAYVAGDRGFGTFLLSKDCTIGNKVMKVFNLIDRTNKELYPVQTHSYRQNLKIIYPNGFDGNIF
ncbi:hypothetical protein Me_995_000036 [Mycoplasmopsis edwardii]|uniref:Uncharacterized protein n=1 Tax=Mycoplasmopsis edwardii TaxID=53558 RepID=A0ACD4PHH8_9BACT|nr:hypothetical protein [Mycoplasmopsis edwardii]WBP84090.1 hypothetical protein Me_995_000036 [Mycoplasmopsis edwardii]